MQSPREHLLKVACPIVYKFARVCSLVKLLTNLPSYIHSSISIKRGNAYTIWLWALLEKLIVRHIPYLMAYLYMTILFAKPKISGQNDAIYSHSKGWNANGEHSSMTRQTRLTTLSSEQWTHCHARNHYWIPCMTRWQIMPGMHFWIEVISPKRSLQGILIDGRLYTLFSSCMRLICSLHDLPDHLLRTHGVIGWERGWRLGGHAECIREHMKLSQI